MKSLVVACAFSLLSPFALAADTTPITEDDKFIAIYESEWKWRSSELGYSETDKAGLPDVGAKAQAAREKKWREVLASLEAIDVSQLSREQRINFQVYQPQLEDLADNVKYGMYEMPFNSDSSFWSNLSFMVRRSFNNAEDYQRYIDRLSDVPRYFAQNIKNMEAGLRRGFSVPREVLDGRDVSISTVADQTNIEAMVFWEPFKAMPASIPAQEQARLRQEAKEVLRDKVRPAFVELLTFFREEYVPNARKTLAAEAMPNGVDFYRQQIREYTTLDLEPEAIHQIGLSEVARIKQEMHAIIEEVKFDGDFPAFLEFLRTDPQFYAKTPEELLMRAAWISKRVDANLAKYFTLPRARFTIVPVPPDIAPFWTAGRGGANTYWLNTYNLPARPLYNLPALTLHESDPGHAMQGALAAEQEAQPDFRRYNYISAFGEGWGLYTEKLGVEMGVYETPYENFGRLTYEMWRAARLVIDTGVHHKGWTRDQALSFLRDNTALSEHEVTTEVDRYISWPAQALSYKLGEIKILELRAKAEKELGKHFEIRKFHDAILALGSVPLPVLEEQMNLFIAEHLKEAASK